MTKITLTIETDEPVEVLENLSDLMTMVTEHYEDELPLKLKGNQVVENELDYTGGPVHQHQEYHVKYRFQLEKYAFFS